MVNLYNLLQLVNGYYPGYPYIVEVRGLKFCIPQSLFQLLVMQVGNVYLIIMMERKRLYKDILR